MCSFVYVLSRLECVGHSFAYVAHFVFLRDVWIRSFEPSHKSYLFNDQPKISID
jgi:hypothetical protein